MDVILKVIVWTVAAWFAYAAVAAERRSRNWSPFTTIGVYLTLFGGITFGLIRIESYFTDKLVGDSAITGLISPLGTVVLDPSEGQLLLGGVIVLAFVVLFALDLLGKVDLMGQIQAALNKSSTGGGATGTGPSSAPPSP